MTHTPDLTITRRWFKSTRSYHTIYAWINSIFLVMNLLILLRIFFALCKSGFAVLWMPLLKGVERLVCYKLAHDTRRRGYLYQMATY